MATASPVRDEQVAGAVSPLRPRSPPGKPLPPYGQGGLDGSGEFSERPYFDFKMDQALSWNSERPETEYRVYARNLQLWLSEATSRLPPTLIGRRITDVVPFGSRVAALLAHLTADDITAIDRYKRI